MKKAADNLMLIFVTLLLLSGFANTAVAWEPPCSGPGCCDWDGEECIPNDSYCSEGEICLGNCYCADPDGDLDGDGLTNYAEYNIYGTDPNDVDTDGDGLVDGLGECVSVAVYPGGIDEDDDGYVDGEKDFGTDPLDSDTDDDGLSDGWEVDNNTDPTKSDTDGDGLSDKWEVDNNTNPTNVDTDGDGLVDGSDGYVSIVDYPGGIDKDGDGYVDGESDAGTDPTKSDTDDDDLPDGWEYLYNNTDPLVDDKNEDTDGDGISNYDEYLNGLNPDLDESGMSWSVNEYDTAGAVICQKVCAISGGSIVCLSQANTDYDTLGRVWRKRVLNDPDYDDPNSAIDNTNDKITLYTFDDSGNLNKTAQKGIGLTDPDAIDPNDIVTENIYDSLGRVTSVTDAEGNQTTYTYNSGGQLHYVTDPNGNITTYSYDDAGRGDIVIDAEEHYKISYFDSLGRVVKQYAYNCDDVKLMQKRIEYDNLSHVTRRAIMADADSSSAISTTADNVTDYTYNGTTGLLTSQKVYYGSTPSEAVTSYDYDNIGRRYKTTDPAGNIVELTFNALSWVTQRKRTEDNPLGSDLVITTNYVFDEYGRTIQQRAVSNPSDPNTDLVTEFEYNNIDRMVKKTDPKDIQTSYDYNTFGQRTEMIADVGGIAQKTEWSYDRLGRQSSIKGYADGSTAQTTSYAYNKLGKVTTITYPDNETISYTYNDTGTVGQRTDQRGLETNYAYDGLGQMTQKSVTVDSVTTTETFTYDGLGRMLTADKDEGATSISDTTFTYNDIGRIADANEIVLNAAAVVISYDYDQAGNLIEITYPDANTVEITPDALGRIDTLKIDSSTEATYKYIGQKVIQRNYSLPNVTYDIEHNNLGRATRRYTYKNGTPDTTIVDFNYTFDDNGNIDEISFDHRPSSPDNEHTYDNLDGCSLKIVLKFKD